MNGGRLVVGLPLDNKKEENKEKNIMSETDIKYGPGTIGEWNRRNPEKSKLAKAAGGKATSKITKERRLLKDYLATLLELKSESGCLYDDITLALIRKAIDGDIEAYKTIRSTLGQDAPNKVEMSTSTISINIE